ncbi:Glyoxylase, beta-lactamase superfamily II [Paramicrobacterium humi]|uniref:Glyoxylase, beta-lactamase superfamily II n=1 Tax=Paramicrobacterium humi TaxID=640635 RepID=A0A1H4KTW1_9MICO|nr:N-acyl homoserine lactonase family protein [Microbacterium humi]SEB61352.1 Glyoxylase, beta-lactamase superfamily II [Microbacterium humi]
MSAASNSPDTTWEIFVIKHGTRETSRSDVFMNYGFYSEPDDKFELAYYLWVLRQGERVIHIDTGYSEAGATKRGRTVLADPLLLLSSLGFDPAAGNPLVVTHAHYDHIGNLPAFSNSPIYISRKELEFWTSDLGTRSLFSHFGDQVEIADLVSARHQGRVHEFEGSIQIAPGVELVEVGGHTPGQLIVRIQTAVGEVVLASDAAHFHEELERDMLFQSMADLPRSYRALDFLRGSEAVIVTGHDAGEIERFAPVDQKFRGLVSTIGTGDA